MACATTLGMTDRPLRPALTEALAALARAALARAQHGKSARQHSADRGGNNGQATAPLREDGKGALDEREGKG